MNVKKLHCFAGKRWSGDATSALNSALNSGGIVITEGDEEIEQRFRRSGVEDVRRLNMSGLFGSLNLSRILRLTMPEQVLVYSSALLPKLHQAVALAKMPDVEIVDLSSQVFLPEVKPADQGNSLIWIGYITENCGLRSLLEALKDIPDVKLKVVGVGKAKIVSPMLKYSKIPALHGRVDWVGEKENVFAEMNGCKAGVITSDRPQEKVVFYELKRAGLPIISGTDAQKLKQEIISLL